MRPASASLAMLGLALLPALATAQAPLPDVPPAFRLVLKGDGDPLVLDPGEADLRKAVEALVAKFGVHATSSNSYKVVVAYFAPTFYAKLQEAAITSAKKAFRIELSLAGGRWPRAVLQNDGEKRIELGEGGMGERTLEEIKTALLHEAGHLGDDAFCGTVDYGADKAHYLEEINSPSVAFFEGWGNLQELLFAPYSPKIAEGYLGKPMVELYAEKPGIQPGVAFKDGYLQVPAAELRLTDFVANECFVANVLYDISELAQPPWDLPQLLTEAFKGTAGIECRTLYDLLGALTRESPFLREQVLGIVKKHSTAGGRAVGSDAEYSALVDGAWSSPVLSHARSRPTYQAATVGATLGQ